MKGIVDIPVRAKVTMGIAHCWFIFFIYKETAKAETIHPIIALLWMVIRLSAACIIKV
jgi:hypothetical protein